jgi:hypothetical protein
LDDTQGIDPNEAKSKLLSQVDRITQGSGKLRKRQRLSVLSDIDLFG